MSGVKGEKEIPEGYELKNDMFGEPRCRGGTAAEDWSPPPRGGGSGGGLSDLRGFD